MSMVVTTKTNFTHGELSPELYGRMELSAYENGAKTLRNVFIQPTGGVTRRAGLRYVDTAAGAGRLVAFEFNTEQRYLLVFTDLQMAVHTDGVKTATLATPWTTAQIPQIVWSQTADTLLVVHPEVSPRKITRTSHSAWTIAEWVFHEKDGVIHQPTHKFADDAVTLTPSGTGGSITVTASAATFQAGHVGLRLRIAGKEVAVTAFTSATQITADVKETLSGTAATKDWEEQAFSALRGWPRSVTFHQDRMVIGGSRDLPNRLWLSKSSDLFNFDLGEGLDDEAIEFALLSDQVNAIRAVFSGRHLQVMTSGAEWMVTGEPLTPGKIQLKRQTRVGSIMTHYVPPRDVDGATLFAGAGGNDLREFLFADVEQAYQATDLALLSHHLVSMPRDMDYDATRRLLHVVMGDGSLATVTNYRSEKVTAWTRQTTDGAFRSVAVVGGDVYVLVLRGEATLVEVLDDGAAMDSSLSGSSGTPKTLWTGLGHLEGRTVQVLADDAVADDAVVASGAITLAEAASSVQVGLPFTHVIEPLPPVATGAGGGGQATTIRLVRAVFRLHETAAFYVDTGGGLTLVPLRTLPMGVLDAAPAKVSADVSVRALGWYRGGPSPLWRNEQSTPLPCTLLSVSVEQKVK
ncbi:MAG: hypothetical protein HQL34_01770 [Alphaproteobacteria bacterium]|nr:hypothetical protein [Alphaproteobacteria bacterium]